MSVRNHKRTQACGNRLNEEVTRLIELLFPQFDLMRKFEDIVDLNISTNNSVMGGAIGAGRSHDVVGSMAPLTDRFGRSRRISDDALEARRFKVAVAKTAERAMKLLSALRFSS